MLESKHQTKMIKVLETDGFVCIKIINSNWNGIPDVIVLIGGGRHFWIEVKRPVGVHSHLQQFRKKTLEKMGDIVMVPYGYEDFLKQYDELRNSGRLNPVS